MRKTDTLHPVMLEFEDYRGVEDSQGLTMTITETHGGLLQSETFGEGQEWPHTIVLTIEQEVKLLKTLVRRQAKRVK